MHLDSECKQRALLVLDDEYNIVTSNMNLELLDPFGRQVPDRVDATIQLADVLHFPPQQQRRVSSVTLQPSTTTTTATTKLNKRGGGKVYDDDDEDDDDEDDEEDHAGNDDYEESPNIETTKSKRNRFSVQQNSRQRRNIEKQTSAAANEMDFDDDDEWKAAYHVAYNRRGNYLAVGYGSGTVAVFSTLTRTLSALYYTDGNNNHHSDHSTKTKSGTSSSKSKSGKATGKYGTGCSSLSWSRRSRRLLIGSFGATRVKLYDTTHPLGTEDCAAAAAMLVSVGQTATGSSSNAADHDDADNDSIEKETTKSKVKDTTTTTPVPSRRIMLVSPGSSSNIIQPVCPSRNGQSSPFARNDDDELYTFVRKTLPLTTKIVEPDMSPSSSSVLAGDKIFNEKNNNYESKKAKSSDKQTRYPCVSFHFQHTVVGSLQLHPRYPHTGVSVLSDGSLVIFYVPYTSAFVKDEADSSSNTNKMDHTESQATKSDSVIIMPLYMNQMVLCASFDSLGNRIYAVTKSGTLLGFDVTNVWTTLSNPSQHQPQAPTIEPTVVISRNSSSKTGDADTPTSSSGVSIWHLIVSRNGKFLIINSSDGTIKLYNTTELWNSTSSDDAESLPSIKPTWTFQDVVTKVKFASCDLSGDGEFVVGGANGADNKYELHIWNTSTGALMDKLTGASTKLYSVAWHPTRSFIAVACADGLVDVWGPRINWTAFAPDFQALPMNVEYIEREDEFDVDENGRYLAEGYDVRNGTSDALENLKAPPISVTKIERVPVFASDSEDEEEVFEFETRVKNLLAGRLTTEGKMKDKKGALDD